jgi:lipopolysaccharide/colanic/teichoic acid biosynthesis glycosyltransferase
LVLVGIPSIARERLDSIAVEAAAANCNVAFVPELSRVKDSSTSYADFDGLLVASLNGSSSRPAYEIAKATVDRMGALLLILLTLPAWLVIAALIRLDSKGPVFFYQTRIGRRGVPFRMFKFRSMRVDAPKYGYHPSGTFDPRVTRVGRWLRRSSLDELPQLLNVLLGTMSLVGPRPEMPFIAEKYTPFEQQRLAVTPGITGLWQISADRAFMIHENLQYDLYYIHNRNFFMDIALLVHTLMFAMRGV